MIKVSVLTINVMKALSGIYYRKSYMHLTAAFHSTVYNSLPMCSVGGYVEHFCTCGALYSSVKFLHLQSLAVQSLC